MQTPMQEQIKPRTHSVAETAKILCVGLSTVKQLVARSELRSFRIGKRVLIPASEIDRFIAERLRQSEPAIA